MATRRASIDTSAWSVELLDSVLVSGSPLACVRVGNDQESFMIHGELLCSFSGYFQGALKGGFVEAQKQECSLPDEDPVTFRYLSRWFYMGDDCLTKMKRELESDEFYGQLCFLWIHAAKLIMPALQNAIIDQLHDFKEWSKLEEHWWLIWYGTSSTSKLRQLLLHRLSRDILYDGIDQFNGQYLPSNVLMDVLDSMHKRFNAEQLNSMALWPIDDARYYHEEPLSSSAKKAKTSNV